MTTQIYPQKYEDDRLQTDASQINQMVGKVQTEVLIDSEKKTRSQRINEEIKSYKDLVIIMLFILSGNLNLGYSVGYLTVSFNSMFKAMQLVYFIYSTLDGSVTSEQGLFSAVFPIGCIVGSILSHIMIKQMSRNKSLMVADLFGMSSILQLVAIREMIITFRFMYGVCQGISCIIMPIYVKELCPDKYYNQFSVVAGFQIGAGLLFSYLMGLGYLNDTLETSWWRVVFAVPALLCLIRQLVITVIYRMESPLSLKNDDCKILLAKIYKPDCVDQVYERCQQRLKDKNQNQSKFLDIWNKKNLKTLMIGLVLMFIYTWCGCFAVFSYSNQMFQIIVQDDETLEFVFSLILGISSFMAIFVSGYIYSRWSKKSLLLSGMILIIICQAFVIGLSYTEDLVATMIKFVIICIFAFIYSATLGPICWGMTPEINNSEATEFCILTGWVWQLIMLYIYPSLMDSMGIGGTFIIFIVATIISLIYFYFNVKETKNLTPYQIDQLYGKIM